MGQEGVAHLYVRVVHTSMIALPGEYNLGCNKMYETGTVTTGINVHLWAMKGTNKTG
jgi:hypothetical protein